MPHATPSEVLFVSKPIAPPWNDGTKNLVRDLAEALGRDGRVRPVVCGRAGAAPAVAHARSLGVFPSSGSAHALGLADAARLMAMLALGPVPRVVHFVASPTARAARAARAIARVRGLRTVQTVASAPRMGSPLGAGLFAERIVVLSRWMEALSRDAAPAGSRVIRVPPPVRLLARPDDGVVREIRARVSPAGEPILLFAGDLGPERGSESTVRALALLPGVRLVVGARPKGARATEHLAALHALCGALGVRDRVSFVGDTPLVHAYIAAADVVSLPAIDATAKIDLPLVLLEAMLLERPVVVAAGTPAAELSDAGAARSAEPTPDALATVIRALLADTAASADLGRRARAYVEHEHDPARVARAHVAIYEELTS